MSVLPDSLAGWLGLAILAGSLLVIVALERRKRRVRRERDALTRYLRAAGYPPERGQALVEFALVLPLFLFLLLAVVELGSFGVRWIRWQSLVSQMAAGTQDDTLPPWWANEADKAACAAPDASLTPGDPLRVRLDCTYHGIAVNGLEWRVTVDGIAANPSTSPTPEPSEEASS